MRVLSKFLPVVVLFLPLSSLAQDMEDFMDRYKVRETVRQMEKERRQRVARGQLISVDTRDREACERVRQDLGRLPNLELGKQSLEDLCVYNPAKPYASVVLLQDMNPSEFRHEIDISPLTNNEKNIVNDTRNLAYSMVGAMGILWAMPESFTKWDKEKIRNSKGGIFSEYADNIRKGPVVDKDDWAVNFIGHPVSGAAYYTMARHAGYSPMQSFGYSVLMSTFFWEYGVEAFAEVPSIQDLILTPVIGSLLGELFYTWSKSIEANGGEVLGSKRLGKIALVLLNPMGSLSDGINGVLGRKFIQDARAYVVARRRPNNDPFAGPGGRGDYYLGIELKFTF